MKESVKTFYLSDQKNSKRVVTICYKTDPKNCKVYYGYAICNPSETFVKKEGRLRAAGRLVLYTECTEYSVKDHYPPQNAIIDDFNDRVQLDCGYFYYRD